MEQTSALSPEALKALRAEYASKATDDQFNLWIEECRSKDLRPVEDVVLQIRTSKEYDPDLKAKVAVKKAVYITTIRALTKIASRTGKYKGKLPTEWIYTSPTFQPSIISTIPLPDPENPRLPLEPWAARVRVQHADFPEPVEEVVRFHAYAQTYRNANGETVLNSVWSDRGPEQLAKCGLAACLRSAFPEAANFYLAEEIRQRDEEDDVRRDEPKKEAEKTVAVPKAKSVPKVDHTPTTAVEETKDAEITPAIRAEDAANQPEEQLEEQPEDSPSGGYADREMTLEERRDFGNKLRAFPVERDALKAFLIAREGTADVKKYGLVQAQRVAEALSAAQAEGKLESLLTDGGK